MFSNSMSRSRRGGWRFFLGLSILGLLVFASASHASSPTPAREGTAIRV